MSMEDIAQEIERIEWERNNLKKRPSQERFEPGEFDYGPEECETCAAPMPAERRAWGFNICVECKGLAEEAMARR